eukprot:6489225-Amphidinium_carterae.1
MVVSFGVLLPHADRHKLQSPNICRTDRHTLGWDQRVAETRRRANEMSIKEALNWLTVMLKVGAVPSDILNSPCRRPRTITVDSRCLQLQFVPLNSVR